jgi:hypothetical protein
MVAGSSTNKRQGEQFQLAKELSHEAPALWQSLYEVRMWSLMVSNGSIQSLRTIASSKVPKTLGKTPDG